MLFKQRGLIHIYKGKEYKLMEVKSANHSLQRNRATTRVEYYGSKEQNRQQIVKKNAVKTKSHSDSEAESVMLSISAAGLRRSMLLSRQDAHAKDAFSQEKTLGEMAKKMEGLSSQIINGHFSLSDRLNFHKEIEKLTEELSRLNDEKANVTQGDCSQLSQRISNFTKIVSEAALYHENAKNIFMESSKVQIGNIKAKFDIAI